MWKEINSPGKVYFSILSNESHEAVPSVFRMSALYLRSIWHESAHVRQSHIVCLTSPHTTLLLTASHIHA